MLYDILVDFPGSQDGSKTERFIAGTKRELSDYLAAIVVPVGWARPVEIIEPVPQESTDEDAHEIEAQTPRRRARRAASEQ